MLHAKLSLEQAWADQVYNGRWFSPYKQAIDAFMASTQDMVSGTIKLKFYKAPAWSPAARAPAPV